MTPTEITADVVAEQVARAMAKSDHLDWDEVCGLQDGGDDCDSSTCIAACDEDHDPDAMRAYYRRHARAAIAALDRAPADAGVAEGSEAHQLLAMLIGYDEEAAPNGIMDCVDNDGSPYQSAAMAGLITHARMVVQGSDLAERVAAHRAALPAAPAPETPHDR